MILPLRATRGTTQPQVLSRSVDPVRNRTTITTTTTKRKGSNPMQRLFWVPRWPNLTDWSAKL